MSAAHNGSTTVVRQGLDPVEKAVQAMAAGRPVIVVDNEDRENEGDIIFAAEHATPALMGWTIRYSSGVICVPSKGHGPMPWRCRPWSWSMKMPRARPTRCPVMPLWA
ncbi:riboflavin biosynthesis protein RibBA [Arthrobacter sp. Hiyo8]|nr:riboflavin biosynthesis protein RibBA [Arthrobacter sp. Hiyo8]